MLKTYLPDNLIVDGFELVPVIGSTLSRNAMINICKSNNIRYRSVDVLSKNLRGKRDLHGNFYQPSKWLFVEKNKVDIILKY